MTSIQKQMFYGLAALIGLCVTWYFNVQAMQLNPDFSYTTFIADNYVNPASASILNDIAVVCGVFFFWCYHESQRIGLRFWWLYIPLSIMIAIAVALPVFLLIRERKLAALG